MQTPDEKIAGLTAIVDIIKKEMPVIHENISKMNNEISVHTNNIDIINKQYESLNKAYNELLELKYAFKILEESVKRNMEDMTEIKNKHWSMLHDETVAHDCPKCSKNDSPMTFEKIVKYAPNIIAIVSFLAFLAYSVLKVKMEGGV